MKFVVVVSVTHYRQKDFPYTRSLKRLIVEVVKQEKRPIGDSFFVTSPSGIRVAQIK